MTTNAPSVASRRPVLWLALLFALLSGIAVVCLRRAEVEAEYDRYHLIGEQLLQGRATWDRFHPFGYPLLLAGMLWLVGDSLIAGGLVSSIAAGVVIWAVSRIADRLRPGAGLGAALLVAGNGVIWVYSAMACSDMTAAAAMLAALALLVDAPDGWSTRRLVGIGVLAGFATSVRFAAAYVVLVAMLWVVRSGGLRSVAMVLVGAVIGYLPQAIPSTLLTGSPLTNENWHNVYLKVVCGFDYECLQHAYDTGTMPTAFGFAWSHFGDIVSQGLRDSWRGCVRVLPAMLFGATWPAAVLSGWPLLLAAGGLVWLAQARRLGAAILVVALLQIATLCLVFEPRTRVMLATMPLLSAGLAVLCHSLPRPRWRRMALACTVAVSLCFGVFSYVHFVAAQPVAEVALARRLPAIVQRPMVLLTTMGLAQRYVEARVLGYMAPVRGDAATTWSTVRERMETAGADVFLVGRASSPVVFAHLSTTAVPADFTVLQRDPDAIALERMPPPSPWIESFTVSPPSPRVGERVAFTLRLQADVAPDRVAGTGVGVRDATGAQSLFALMPQGVGVFTHTFDVPAVTGAWQLTPFVLGADGNARRGAAVAMTVRP